MGRHQTSVWLRISFATIPGIAIVHFAASLALAQVSADSSKITPVVASGPIVGGNAGMPGNQIAPVAGSTILKAPYAVSPPAAIGSPQAGMTMTSAPLNAQGIGNAGSATSATWQMAPNPASAAPNPAGASSGATTTAAMVPPLSAINQAKFGHDDSNPSALKAELERLLARLTPFQRHKYQLASAAFPSFCRDWERKLHDRETDNIAHIAWQQRGGYETASYVGYGPVESCTCKETQSGVPIGKLTYEEFSYYLVGKSLDEARLAKPKLLGQTNTLEIFSFEKDRWFY